MHVRFTPWPDLRGARVCECQVHSIHSSEPRPKAFAADAIRDDTDSRLLFEAEQVLCVLRIAREDTSVCTSVLARGKHRTITARACAGIVCGGAGSAGLGKLNISVKLSLRL